MGGTAGGAAAHATAPRRRARRRWWLWLVLAVLVVAAVSAVVVRRGGPAPQRVFLESVKRGTFVREVSGTGTVEPARSRVLVFPGTGTIAEVWVTDGRRVEQGAPLARLDTRALERDLASNRASLASARADLERVKAQQTVDRLDARAAVSAAENQLASTAQALADARERLADTERLYQVGGAALDERNAARTAVDAAERQARQATLGLESARTRLEGFDALAQAQVKSGEASIARLQTAIANEEQQIADATLNAPFAGVVATVPFKVGDLVAPTGQQGIRFVDDSSVHVVANFDENRSVDLAAGQDATVTPDAAPDLVLPAVVRRVDPVAARGAGTSQLRAELAFAQQEGAAFPTAAVRPGYTVTARVVVHSIPSALLVPLEAIQSSEGTSYLFRVRPQGADRGVAERVDVSVLDRNATLAAVAAEALAEGDRIATTNVDVLREGETVSFAASGGGG